MRLPRRIVLVSALAYLVACSGGDSGGTGPTPKIASSVGISAGTNQSVEVATAVPVPPAVVVRDQNGDPMSGVDVTFTVQSGGGTITGGTATTGANGVATVGSWTLGTLAGANTLRGSVTGLTPATFTATATAGVATALALPTAPSAIVPSGGAFPQQPVVQLRDVYGNDRAQAGVPVTVAIATGGGTLNGTLTENTDATGAANFTNLTIIGTVGPRTLTFTSTGLTSVASGVIDVQVGTPATIVATTSTILGGTVGQPVSNRPTVQVFDGSGNPVVGATVTFTVTSGGGSVTGGSVATGLGGIAQVTSWTLGAVAGDNTLDASVGALPSVTFTATAQAGAAAKLAISTAPSATAQSGSVFVQQPAIQLQDNLGNAVSQAGVVVTATLASGGGTLGGTSTATTGGGGKATFTDLLITGSVGDRTLLFSAPTYASVTSGTITLSAGPAANLALSAGDNQSATVGTTVAIPPAVLVTDASGNPVSGVPVTFALTAGGGGITGGSASSDANGIAALTCWTLGNTAGANTLTATAAGLAGSPVTFTANGTAGAAAALVITTQPSGAVNGVALTSQPVVALHDGFGNPVSQAGVAVSAAIATGGGTLGGTSTIATNASGVATFTNLSLAGTTGNRTLSFSATGLTGATSASFNLTVGSATALKMVTQPSTSANNGSAFATQPRVRLVDAGGNAVSQAGVAVTVSRTPTTAGLGGTLSVNTNVNGVAAFTNLSLTGAVGNYTLGFAATGLTSATSSSIALNAGAAANIVALSPLNQTTGVGTSVANPPSVQVTDGSGNPVPGVAVTFNVTAGGGTISPTNPMTTDATGIATLASWTLGSSAGANTVNASAALVATTIDFNATGSFHVASIAAGSGHSCAVTVDGVGFCWGDNIEGALGDNSFTNRLTPTAIAGGHTFSQISAGRLYSCALTGAGAAWCWGRNAAGALGNGTTASDSVPQPVSGGMVFQVITTGTGGGRQTCAINSASKAYCWGADGSGQLGNGAPIAAVSTPDAVQSLGTWTQLAAGAFYSCGVRTSGAAFCWGEDGFGQLGNGAPKTNTNQPSAVIGGLLFTQVAPGQVHTCGLVTGGAAYCWGANLNGRLGQDTVTTTESLTPLAVTGGLTFTSLVSGESFSCGLTAGGAAYCWGYNVSGQLGNGSTDNATTPTPVAGGLSFASLSAGAGHVCGVTSGGQAYCWGDNSLGQLGDGTVFQRETPTPISQP
ncbi:MAG TPA: hypothetical protein VLK88_13035 [Gemmatimonadales bacterium]|nr:hypothetical protein [Gemmatimonadales bacterium]